MFLVLGELLVPGCKVRGNSLAPGAAWLNGFVGPRCYGKQVLYGGRKRRRACRQLLAVAGSEPLEAVAIREKAGCMRPRFSGGIQLNQA